MVNYHFSQKGKDVLVVVIVWPLGVNVLLLLAQQYLEAPTSQSFAAVGPVIQ